MNIPKLLASLALCFAVAFIGSYVTLPSISTWYVTLHKPFFNPPNWIFGPVWSILYFLMAVSFYLVWNGKGKKKKERSGALKMFLIQLALNFVWSLVFFGLHMPFLAFITIIVLWIAIILTIRSFFQFSETAAYMLYPYMAWVSFAMLLNLFIVLLN